MDYWRSKNDNEKFQKIFQSSIIGHHTFQREYISLLHMLVQNIFVYLPIFFATDTNSEYGLHYLFIKIDYI